MLQGILPGIIMAVALDSIGVDEVRLLEERAGDAAVLSSLQRMGDCSSVVRPIDVRFVGSTHDIDELSKAADGLGFILIQIADMPSGEQAIDLSIQSDAQKLSIDSLTLKALRIEGRFKLRYDGWGTVAEKC
jgi:hypothetical protein